MSDLISIAFVLLRLLLVVFLIPAFLLFPGRRANEIYWHAVGRRIVDTLQWTFVV